MNNFQLICLLLLIQSSIFGQKPRARDIGIPFNGITGKFNAITDVKGVEVAWMVVGSRGFTTLGNGDQLAWDFHLCRNIWTHALKGR
jgi:D-aminopeptidase